MWIPCLAPAGPWVSASSSGYNMCWTGHLLLPSQSYQWDLRVWLVHAWECVRPGTSLISCQLHLRVPLALLVSMPMTFELGRDLAMLCSMATYSNSFGLAQHQTFFLYLNTGIREKGRKQGRKPLNQLHLDNTGIFHTFDHRRFSHQISGFFFPRVVSQSFLPWPWEFWVVWPDTPSGLLMFIFRIRWGRRDADGYDGSKFPVCHTVEVETISTPYPRASLPWTHFFFFAISLCALQTFLISKGIMLPE